MAKPHTFIDNSEFLNIELGAGCGNFGQLFFAKCYITDSDETLKTRCEKHHLDLTCSVVNMPMFKDDRFEHVLMCNPYHYGFKEVEDAQKLMDEVSRVLKDKGKVVIVCHDRNKFCAPNRVEKRLKELTVGKTVFSFKVEDIDAGKEYPKFQFRQTTGIETTPNKRITIDVSK
jgi:ubiquinone/menaquinone biosynthesis C-methylase UbiE